MGEKQLHFEKFVLMLNCSNTEIHFDSLLPSLPENNVNFHIFTYWLFLKVRVCICVYILCMCIYIF